MSQTHNTSLDQNDATQMTAFEGLSSKAHEMLDTVTEVKDDVEEVKDDVEKLKEEIDKLKEIIGKGMKKEYMKDYMKKYMNSPKYINKYATTIRCDICPGRYQLRNKTEHCKKKIHLKAMEQRATVTSSII